MTKNQNKFMFYENFLNAIEQLPKEEQANACLEFCRYGISGNLPKNKYLSMFCLGVSASVQKYQGRGGIREGAGRPKKQENQQVKGNQKNQKNQKNQNEQTETINTKHKLKTETEKEYVFEGEVIKLNEKDYNEWKEKFNLLDFDYELEKRDIWLSGQENTKSWFISTKQYFLGLQREKEKAKEEEARLMSNWWRE
jgi:hypothetical protein